ncbi:MAG: class II glutamine amidotransferase [Kiritimatiellae bacterium]|nr:class II glutamine amidotransferase [Kiritimatiellia bacterium]
MCELLGVTAKRRLRLNALLREFYSHSSEHPHGWGLACFPDSGTPVLEKEPVEAGTSLLLNERLASPVLERTVIAHIRRATIGHLTYENTHPFTTADNRGRRWTLAHNGTIFNGSLLERFKGRQKGETDSECILFYLIEQIDRTQDRLGRALDETERFDLLAEAVADLSANGKVNLLVYDGDLLYAHVNLRGTLYYRKEEDALVFSTRPLKEGDWHHVPPMRLVAAKDGDFRRIGEDHGHEYCLNPDDYRYTYMLYAAL